MTVFDVKKKREKWIKEIKKYDVKKLVFLDESGININMTRRYGRTVGGKRVADSVPQSRPVITTVLSSIQLDGTTIYTTYQGGTTKERFTEYLKNKLIPKLKKGSIIVMDNLRTHHSKEAVKIIKKAKMIPLFLPPYSPDFNPIEKMWSKIKSFLRMKKSRSLSALPSALKLAFYSVSKSDCTGWFSSCFLSC